MGVHLRGTAPAAAGGRSAAPSDVCPAAPAPVRARPPLGSHLRGTAPAAAGGRSAAAAPSDVCPAAPAAAGHRIAPAADLHRPASARGGQRAVRPVPAAPHLCPARAVSAARVRHADSDVGGRPAAGRSAAGRSAPWPAAWSAAECPAARVRHGPVRSGGARESGRGDGRAGLAHGAPARAAKRPHRLRRIAGTAFTVLLLAAAAVVLFLRFHHAPFHTSGATIIAESKSGCAVNVTGRIDTNGAAGTVSYQWVFQPQSEAPQPQSQSAISGQHSRDRDRCGRGPGPRHRVPEGHLAGPQPRPGDRLDQRHHQLLTKLTAPPRKCDARPVSRAMPRRAQICHG